MTQQPAAQGQPVQPQPVQQQPGQPDPSQQPQQAPAQQQPVQPQPAAQQVPQQPITAPASPSAGASSASTAVLTTDDGQNPSPAPLTAEAVGAENIADQFSAVINVHNCNLQQIEVAIAANMHQVDPHPAQQGMWVRRHPIYIVAENFGERDEQGRPLAGAPLELDLDTIRKIYSSRHAHVSAEAPPQDGSHISVKGMHTIPEYDSRGQATGRVRLGSPDEIPQNPDAAQAPQPAEAPTEQLPPQAPEAQAAQPQEGQP